MLLTKPERLLICQIVNGAAVPQDEAAGALFTSAGAPAL